MSTVLDDKHYYNTTFPELGNSVLTRIAVWYIIGTENVTGNLPGTVPGELTSYRSAAAFFFP
jgi:hypothetical protein